MIPGWPHGRWLLTLIKAECGAVAMLGMLCISQAWDTAGGLPQGQAVRECRRPVRSREPIDAVFDNGVLSMRVPKLQAGATADRRVAVRTQ